MKYPFATRGSASALVCVLTLLLMISQSHIAHAQDSLRWSAGIRTGSYYELERLRGKAIADRSYQGKQTGFLHQLFVNVTPGRQGRLMLEANVGYNSIAYENTYDNYFGFPYSGYFTAQYDNYLTRVLSVNLEVKYKVLTIPALRWKHYAGLSLGMQQQFTDRYGLSTRYPEEVSTETRSNNSEGNTRFGLVYSGKIDISRRLSVQYNAGYGYAPDSDYKTHRVQGVFGFGYNF